MNLSPSSESDDLIRHLAKVVNKKCETVSRDCQGGLTVECIESLAFCCEAGRKLGRTIDRGGGLGGGRR